MASLDPNTAVLGKKNARHLLRRATFTYTKALVDQFAALTPKQALDLLLVNGSPALNLPYAHRSSVTGNPPDGYWTELHPLPSTINDFQDKTVNIAGWWWYNAINSPTLKYKMSHFLSTRFTIEKVKGGRASNIYEHLRLLLFYSYGNYKTLAKKMTLDNAMLIYLNNTANIKNAPNQNYAREFLELFTIGKGPQIGPGNYTTYTETDIIEAAKLLTGFRQTDRTIVNPLVDTETGIPKGKNTFNQHVTTSKNFSSAFNNTIIASATNDASMDTELNDFVEMVFKQQATAQNICRKLYQYFVKTNITTETETNVIKPLALDLFNGGYEMAPIIRKLLESKHFYDLDDTNANDEIIGGIIKSPLQQLSEMCTYLQATIPDPTNSAVDFYESFWIRFAHNSYLSGANMLPFDPENVAGHNAYHQAPDFDKSWISSATLIPRYRLGESLLDGKNRIVSNADIKAKIDITTVIKTGSIVSTPSDPLTLTTELCNALFAQEPSVDRVKYFMNSFLLQGLTNNYWTDAWNTYLSTNNNTVVEVRLKKLLMNILRAPESQIF
jgi:uncharacterized protein (DUF1800 family)